MLGTGLKTGLGLGLVLSLGLRTGLGTGFKKKVFQSRILKDNKIVVHVTWPNKQNKQGRTNKEKASPLISEIP